MPYISLSCSRSCVRTCAAWDTTYLSTPFPTSSSAADSPGKKPTPRRGLSHIGFPGSALASAKDAGAARLHRKNEREQRTRREQLLAAGLVTRPEGNRVQARQMDRERYKRVEKELGPSVASGKVSNIFRPSAR